MSTKIHACTEALGNAVRLIATGGQAGDCPQALPLLKGLQPGKVLADTAYDSDENRAYCAQHGIEAVIPSRPNRLEPALMDAETSRDRNKIERLAVSKSIGAWPRATKKRPFLFGVLAYRGND